MDRRLRRRAAVGPLLGWGTGFVVAAIAGAGTPARAQGRSPCSAVREHVADTVLVFEPPSTVTICRGGEEQRDVVTGRPVYFQLSPSPGSSMFEFRVPGQGNAWTHTGLSTWQEQATRIEGRLRDVEHGGAPIADIPVPRDAGGPASPLRPLAAARERYVDDVTERFLDALHAVRSEIHELPVIANVTRRWCTELASQGAGGAPEGDFKARCGGPELEVGRVDHDVEAFESAASDFDRARDAARDALVAATAHPDDAGAVDAAVKALDDARRAAAAVMTAARTLRVAGRGLMGALVELRMQLRSIDAIRPGVPMYLATYGAEGNAELEVDATPVDIAAGGKAAAQANVGKTTARFPVVAPHYIDLEAGLGISGGVPLVPYEETVGGVQTIQGKPVDQLVGLALVELEPARFLWPDRPLAGILRFPVLALPFTRDPTQNFFAGAGLGWTGVGSIVAGPYLQYALTLRDGYSFGQAIPSSTSIQGATEQLLRAGWFVSASVDLLGLFHVFVPSHGAAIDAATGKEK